MHDMEHIWRLVEYHPFEVESENKLVYLGHVKEVCELIGLENRDINFILAMLQKTYSRYWVDDRKGKYYASMTDEQRVVYDKKYPICKSIQTIIDEIDITALGNY